MVEAISENPLLVESGYIPFDRIQVEHIEPAVRQKLQELEQRVAEIEANIVPTWEGLMVELEAIGKAFEYLWAPVGHLLSVKNSDALREVFEKMMPQIITFTQRIGQSRPIYQGVKAIKDGSAWDKLDQAQQRVIELRLKDFDRSGVGLEGKAKERFNEIQTRISQITTEFSNHVLDAVKAYELIITDPEQTQGWPLNLKQTTAQSYAQANDTQSDVQAGPWRVTLDGPVMSPFLQHHRGREQRKEVYLAYVTRASSGELDNTQLIVEELKLRKEKVGLLGFNTFAEYSIDTKMAPSVQAVEQMSEQLAAAAKPFADREFKALGDYAAQQGFDGQLKHWDVGFYAERMREALYDFTDDQLRPYFPMPRVLEGLFSLCGRLFDIEIKLANSKATVWHEDVSFYEVFDKTAGQKIASFYLDPYSRPADKRGGAWMDSCMARRRTQGKLQLPVVYLVCNGTQPVGDQPSFMSFGEVLTLFHEFGHGLQGMLTTVDYADVAGVNGVEWDAVELASQFMENWCYHKPTLLGMTSHVETGQPLPDGLFDKIVASKNYRSGSAMMRQVQFGVTDMRLHHQFDPDGQQSFLELGREIAMAMSSLPPLSEDRSLCAFSHIFAGGYCAGYYSYKWAEVLSADAFAAFEEVGLDNEEKVTTLGRRYRDTILALGGSRHPMEVYKDFRGRAPSTDALLRHSGLTD